MTPVEQRLAATKEKLKQDFFKECYDEFHSDHQALFIFDWFYNRLTNQAKELTEKSTEEKAKAFDEGAGAEFLRLREDINYVNPYRDKAN